jgi:PA14 domain-containing protein
MRTLLLGAAFGAAVLTTRAEAYIDSLYPLARFIAESEAIAEGTLEKVDAKNKTCLVRVARSVKGKLPLEVVRINVGAGQEWHPDLVLKHLVVGAPAVVFSTGGRAELYVNRFFLQLYGDATAAPEKAWWNFAHVELRCNRTFNGTAEELAGLVGDVVAGRAKAPGPDAKLPAITRDDLADLPAWGQPETAPLPAAFRRKPRAPENPSGAVAGLAVQYYEGRWTALPELDGLTPARTATCDTFALGASGPQENYALRFKGFLEIPKDGTYTFTTSSNDGSRLFIGSVRVVDNDHLDGAARKSGQISLKAGKHAITVTYFQAGGVQSLDVSWEGPGLSRQPIPASALFQPVSP